MERYTIGELEGLAEEAEERIQEYFKERLGDNYIPPTDEQTEENISSRTRAYIFFNEVFGKPEDGKFF